MLYINKLIGSNHRIVIPHLIDRPRYIIIMQALFDWIMIIYSFGILYTGYRKAWLE